MAGRWVRRYEVLSFKKVKRVEGGHVNLRSLVLSEVDE